MTIKFITDPSRTNTARIAPENARLTARDKTGNSIPLLNDIALREEGKDEQTKHDATKKEEDKQVVSDLIKNRTGG